MKRMLPSRSAGLGGCPVCRYPAHSPISCNENELEMVIEATAQRVMQLMDARVTPDAGEAEARRP